MRDRKNKEQQQKRVQSSESQSVWVAGIERQSDRNREKSSLIKFNRNVYVIKCVISLECNR